MADGSLFWCGGSFIWVSDSMGQYIFYCFVIVFYIYGFIIEESHL